MLENNHSTLYQSDYYKRTSQMIKDAGTPEELKEFEKLFSLANTIYIESKKCIEFTPKNSKSYNYAVTKRSETITSILKQNPEVYEILDHASTLEERLHPNATRTAIASAAYVCMKHLEDLKKKNTQIR